MYVSICSHLHLSERGQQSCTVGFHFASFFADSKFDCKPIELHQITVCDYADSLQRTAIHTYRRKLFDELVRCSQASKPYFLAVNKTVFYLNGVHSCKEYKTCVNSANAGSESIGT